MRPARGPQTEFSASFCNLGHLVAARVEAVGLVQTADARESPKAIFGGISGLLAATWDYWSYL